MAYIRISYADGRYSTHLHKREEKDAQGEGLEVKGAEVICIQEGAEVIRIQDRIYDAYLRHREADADWQKLWGSIAVVQYRCREQEETQREIERLKEKLARSKEETLREIEKLARSKKESA